MRTNPMLASMDGLIADLRKRRDELDSQIMALAAARERMDKARPKRKRGRLATPPTVTVDAERAMSDRESKLDDGDLVRNTDRDMSTSPTVAFVGWEYEDCLPSNI